MDDQALGTRAKREGMRIQSTRIDKQPPFWETPQDLRHVPPPDGWRVTLKWQGRSMTLEFWKGVGHGGEPPAIGEVLDALLSDASSVENVDGFEEWAMEFGYDPDSRRHEQAYTATVKQTERTRRFLGDAYEKWLWEQPETDEERKAADG